MQIAGFSVTIDQILWAVLVAGVLYLLLDGIFNYKPPVLCGKPCPRCGCGCEYQAGHESEHHGHFVPGRRIYPVYHCWDEGGNDLTNHPSR